MEKSWYAIYTKPKAEKKVYEQLLQQNYITYLPLKTEYRQWKDRIKKIEVPLFRSYVFVKIDEKEYYEIIKNIKGIVKFVTFGGKKIKIRNEEIEAIKKLIKYSKGEIEVRNDDLEIGEKIEIKYGNLKGLKGYIVEIRGKNRLLVRIDSLYTNLLIEIRKTASIH